MVLTFPYSARIRENTDQRISREYEHISGSAKYEKSVNWLATTRLVTLIHDLKPVNPFHPSLVFHIETSHLIYTANQTAGFYIKCNTGLYWVKRVQRHMQLADLFECIFSLALFSKYHISSNGRVIVPIYSSEVLIPYIRLLLERCSKYTYYKLDLLNGKSHIKQKLVF